MGFVLRRPPRQITAAQHHNIFISTAFHSISIIPSERYTSLIMSGIPLTNTRSTKSSQEQLSVSTCSKVEISLTTEQHFPPDHTMMVGCTQHGSFSLGLLHDSTHSDTVRQFCFHDFFLQQLDVALSVDALVVGRQLLILVPGGCSEACQTTVPVANQAWSQSLSPRKVQELHRLQ